MTNCYSQAMQITPVMGALLALADDTRRTEDAIFVIKKVLAVDR